MKKTIKKLETKIVKTSIQVKGGNNGVRTGFNMDGFGAGWG